MEHGDIYKCDTEVLQTDVDILSEALKAIAFGHLNDKQSQMRSVHLR